MPSEGPITLVVVGASAGGLEPIERFFSSLPPNPGAAFVVLQHLSPDFKSLMPQLLGRRTPLPIRLVEDTVSLELNTIFLIPPGKNLIMDADQLLQVVESEPTRRGPAFPIDLFLTTAAPIMGHRLLAIILSGSGSDGSQGIRSVYDFGGGIFVQHPQSAQFDGMPRSALDTGIVHTADDPEELSLATMRFIMDPSSLHLHETGAPGLMSDSQIEQVLTLLREDGGLDFTNYKRSTLRRRAERRAGLLGCASVEAFIQLLRSSEEERADLSSDLLIGVTSFFRDPDVWLHLARDVLPKMLTLVPKGGTFRVWVTACSTGQEAYSMAMLLDELIRKQEHQIDFKIFATDLNTDSLAFAAAGRYPLTIQDQLTPERLRRYMERRDESYVVNRQLREKLIFARQDLSRDAPFTRMDMVSCRNVLIYMKPNAQKHVLRMLHFALNFGGVLLLGRSETPGFLKGALETLGLSARTFRKSGHTQLVAQGRAQVPKSNHSYNIVPPKVRLDRLAEHSFGEYLRHIDAACALVDLEDQVLRTYGHSTLYFRVPEGPPTTNIMRIVLPELSLPLNTALRRIRQGESALRFENLPASRGGEERRINLEVKVSAAPTGQRYILVILSPSTPVEATAEPLNYNDASAARLNELELKLQQARESLQATIEELETTNEEQQATNEELMASNEELQSTNEELQSVNEELYTVNSEFQSKIKELTDTNNDLDNLLRSTGVGTIFLDRELCIRKFTPEVTRYINLTSSDLERPIGHFTHHFNMSDFYEVLQKAVDGGERFEAEVRVEDTTAVLRIQPYLLEDEEIAGVVVTILENVQGTNE